jgi:hypothetical protein
MSDVVLLICALVDDPMSTPSATSTRGHYCHVCADEIWMSPRMKNYWDEHPSSRPTCPRCATNMPDADDADVRALPGDRVDHETAQALHRGLRRHYGTNK